MTANILHLTLVHITILGFPLALGLILVGLKKKIVVLQKTAYLIAGCCCLVCGVNYFSGPPSYDNLKSFWKTESSSQSGITNHKTKLIKEYVENHALLGRLVFMEAVVFGVLLLIQVLNAWQGQPIGKAGKAVFLALLLVLSLTGLFTAHEGGKIRRPELWGHSHLMP